MLRITVTTKTKIDTGRPNLTVAEINLLLPFTITGIPDELSDDQRDALSTLVCQGPCSSATFHHSNNSLNLKLPASSPTGTLLALGPADFAGPREDPLYDQLAEHGP